jgi:hypothetical protein
MRLRYRLAILFGILIPVIILSLSLLGRQDDKSSITFPNPDYTPLSPVSAIPEGKTYSFTSLQYTDLNNQQKNIYALSGCITIITKDTAIPDDIRTFIKKNGGNIYVEIPECGLYFTDGLSGREASIISTLSKLNDIIHVFPTPVCAVKGEFLVEDFKTVITNEGGYYLHYDNIDGTFSWQQSKNGALTHGELSAILSDINRDVTNVVDCAYTETDKTGKENNYMDVGYGLKAAAIIAQKDLENSEMTIVNNSWGTVLDIPKNASTSQIQEATKKFQDGELDSYFTLLTFLDHNPNAIAVKAAGNEGQDISSIMNTCETLKIGNDWDRLVIVGALDSNLNPTTYSNYASGRTDILWVPELTTADGEPIPGTSFVAPQISYLINRIAEERPDLKPEQIVSILFDERVSPRVNLRPTIVNPYSDETLNTVLEVADEKFGPQDNNESNIKGLGDKDNVSTNTETKETKETETPSVGAFTGTWQGTYRCQYVDENYGIYTETTDVNSSVEIYLRQKGSDVVGVVIFDNYKSTGVSSDELLQYFPPVPCPPAHQITLDSGEILGADGLFGTVGADGNLKITLLQVNYCYYEEGRVVWTDEKRDVSISISGNSMKISYYSICPQNWEINASFNLTKVSDQYDKIWFQN